mmetsp:Transcript_32842/g.86316  ORF Transcript_32842/g.86316 Transcript_32842/m.86316 type:complete len:107 (-) Transcript_32842:976-1296(-)
MNSHPARAASRLYAVLTSSYKSGRRRLRLSASPLSLGAHSSAVDLSLCNSACVLASCADGMLGVPSAIEEEAGAALGSAMSGSAGAATIKPPLAGMPSPMPWVCIR